MFNKDSLLIHKKQTVQTVQKARRKRILMYTMQNGGHKYEYTLIHICVFVLFGEFRSTTPKEPFFCDCVHIFAHSVLTNMPPGRPVKRFLNITHTQRGLE